MDAMRVAVLGGTRFIGAAVVDQLRSRGHHVVVLHKGTTHPQRNDVTDVHVDRIDRPQLRDALAAARPDVLVDTCAYERTHAEIAVAALPPSLPVVVLSSMDVYRAFGAYLTGQSTDPVPLTEDAPLRTVPFPYRGSPVERAGIDNDTYDKLHVEQPYLDAGAVVLRLPMVFGERDPWVWEGFVLARVFAGRDRIPFGAGTWVCSRGWVRDVASAVVLAAESNLTSEVMNIAEAQTWSAEQWARAILEATGSSGELVRVPDDRLPWDLALSASTPQHLLLDSSKARRLLSWSDSDPREAVAASVAWHAAHRTPHLERDFAIDDAALDAALASPAGAWSG
jgi:nucleoside-diphosphate-sugar epimerase